MRPDFTFVALHGFASGPRSRKNEHFRSTFAARGLELVTPDMNQPSFGTLSLAAMKDEGERAWEANGRRPLRMIGSSLGGFVAAWFASVHPERVDRLILLCPAFDLAGRWHELITAERLERWRATGWLDFDDARGEPVPLHYAFFLEGREVPRMPPVPCPTIVIHGRQDETVPFDQSVRYAAHQAEVRELVAVDDGHALLDSLDAIDEAIDRLFFRPSPSPASGGRGVG
jgi:pimeloyl-ACP methyl ester carboxylesterase